MPLTTLFACYAVFAFCWLVFVVLHQRERYKRKQPHFADTLVEHFLLFPVGVFLYLASGLLEIRVDTKPR